MVSKSYQNDHTNEPFASDGRDIVKKDTFWVTGTEDGTFFICRRGWLVVKTVSLGPKIRRFLLAAGDG